MQEVELSRALDRAAARNLVAASLFGIPGLVAAAAWLWGTVDHTVLVAMLVSGTASSTLTWSGSRQFLKTSSRRAFVATQIGTAVTSSSCAALPVFGLTGASSTEAQLKVVLVAITILASAATANTASRSLMLLFSGPLAVGLSIGMLRAGSDPFLFIGIVVFLFISDRSYRTARSDTARLLREKHRANDLAEQLADALEATERESLLDPLTGAGNRRLLDRYTSTSAEGTQTVICIDLDHFKQLNDRHGHSVGDELLVMATERIRNVLRKNDALIRSGGDEFIAIVNADLAVAREIARRILRSLCVAYQLSTGPAVIGASIGLSSVGADGSIEAAQRRADQSLYQAKGNGRNRVSEWETGIEAVGPSSGLVR